MTNMDFGNSGSPGAPKKSSIFAGISPAPAPAYSAPAPRPAADADSVAILKQKLDALEKNIVSQLEKKISEQLKALPSASPVAPPRPPSPPPPPPPERSVPAFAAGMGDALLSKIAELERRLGEFSQQASLSASQMRNIEESKISARREIEDLLKAVREQQKYSEIDRQMHSQLEKSWSRVEELEKKLMDFYSSVLAMEARRKEDFAAERGREQSSLGEIKEALSSLARRMEGFERSVQSVPALTFRELNGELQIQLEASREAAAKRQEELFSELRRQTAASASVSSDALKENSSALAAMKEMLGLLAGRLASLEQKAQSAPALTLSRELEERFAAEREADAKRQEEFFEALKRQTAASAAVSEGALKDNAAALRAGFKEYAANEIALLGRQLNSFLEENRRENAAQADALKGALSQHKAVSESALADFSRVAAENRIKAEGVETALGFFADKLQARFEALAGDMLAKTRKENEEKFEKFGAKYADALASLSFLEIFQTAASGAAEKLAYFEGVIGAFVKSVDREDLAKALGVSGMLRRGGFEDLERALGQLKVEKERIENIRASLLSRFRDIFGGKEKP